jgi:drug/metabolite transporter superfamily protein YnfA
MNATDVIVIIALVIATIEEVKAKGQSWLAWAVIFLCGALLWHLAPWA